MGLLSNEVITNYLRELPGWSFKKKSLVKEYTFDSYMKGITFVNHVAEKAEGHNHHPDLEIGWCRVGVTLTSHDAGGVTDRDIRMAKAVEELL